MPNIPTWREKTVVRILLLVAAILNADPEVSKEIYHLGNHISAAKESAPPPGSVFEVHR